MNVKGLQAVKYSVNSWQKVTDFMLRKHKTIEFKEIGL